eukprot:1107143-Prymnesium_polylepis.2
MKSGSPVAIGAKSASCSEGCTTAPGKPPCPLGHASLPRSTYTRRVGGSGGVASRFRRSKKSSTRLRASCERGDHRA